MSDGGPSLKMKVNGETLFVLDDGIDEYVVIPTATHGELSILDNKLFAVAKRWWRLHRHKYPFYLQDLYLLYCIDSVAHDKIQRMWTKNFLLGSKQVSFKEVEDLLSHATKATIIRQNQAEMYLTAYEDLKTRQGFQITPVEAHALEHNLDGKYWMEMDPSRNERRSKK